MTAVFLLCTIILFVLQTLSMKLQHAEHLPQKLLVNCAFSLLAAAAMGAGRLAVPDMFTVSPATLRHGIAFGVLFALTILFYNLAIASGPLSYTTFYFSASMLVPAFAGVLLFGEALTFTLAAAVALFLAAFWCLNVTPGGAQKPEPRWLTLCALTFLCNGLCAVVQKSQQNATGGAEAAGLMLVGFCTAAACYALAYLALRGRLPAGAADGAALLRQNALAAVLLAGGSVGGNLLLTWLAGRVDASYLFPLVQGSIIVGVTLCSVLLFREKLSARGRLGILLGVAAIAVINLSGGIPYAAHWHDRRGQLPRPRFFQARQSSARGGRQRLARARHHAVGRERPARRLRGKRSAYPHRCGRPGPYAGPGGRRDGGAAPRRAAP